MTAPCPPSLHLADIELGENCRRELTDLDELAASIAQVGVLQPLLVCPHQRGGWELVAGYRRYRAAEMAGVMTVPVAPVAPDLDTATVNLVENLHRAELSPIEKAEALRRIRDQDPRRPKTSAQLAAATGWTAGYCQQLLTLLVKLCPEAQQGLHEGRLSWVRACQMLSMPFDVQQRMVATGTRERDRRSGRRPAAEERLVYALAAFRRSDEDAALVAARQAVHELERRKRDGRDSTPRATAPAPTVARDRAERRAIARASGGTNGHRPAATQPDDDGRARDSARTREMAPLAPVGQRAAAADTLDADVTPGRPKVRCADCKQWLAVHVGMTPRGRVLAHREITGCDVTAQLKALPK
jgi:ParB/RepB/Spo0J family partition protein